ncbi:MAG: RND transporter [Betaproteobacteria bacterium HGW-Betaproteobacteria-1]|jgi:multidrug efflux system outer membrane protein|nr:MAG: RND transporter [Betaproteobacteria bacterium HGW-Betaproteobacteria-1]
MKPGMKIIGGLLLTALLPGCMLMGPDYQRPTFSLPAIFSSDDVAAADQAPISAESPWWELYQDPVLNDLVAQALENNTDIKIAVARIEEADAFLREVGAALFPQVDLDAAGSRSRITQRGANPLNGANPIRENYTIRLGASYELDFWGKLRRAKESARAQTMASRYARDTVALSLSGLVVSNYLQLRSLESQITLSEDSLRTRDESLALTRKRLEGGVSSALDVYQAEVASSNLAAQIVELKRLRAVSQHQLAVLTGKLDLSLPAGDISQLPLPPLPPAGLPSNLLEARPDVRQAEQELVAQNANIGVAKAALFPTISLTATYGGESAELSDVLKSAARIWSGGLGLNLPIFNAGRLSAKVDQATAQQKQTLAAYEASVRTAFQEVNDALVTVRQNAEREVLLDSSRQAAKKALDISDNRYKSGYSAYIDVLDSQRVYNDAAIAYIQSRQARLIASVDLFKALGGGWQDQY